MAPFPGDLEKGPSPDLPSNKTLRPVSVPANGLPPRSRLQGVCMLKWKIAAILGLAFGAAGIGWGYAQEKKAVGFFELRVYTAQPGKRDALAARFASRTAGIYARQ